MSPPAAGFALLLHVLVAFLLWWSSTLHHPSDPEEPAIEVTMEPTPPPPPPPPEPKPAPEAPKPPSPMAAPKSPPQQPMNLRGLVPAAPLGEKTQGAGKPTEQRPEAKPTEKVEEPAPEKTEAPQQALAPPPPPSPPPELEKQLPPVETPPAPVTSLAIPKSAPPLPEPKPVPRAPEPRPQPRPEPPQASIAPSPLSRLPQRGSPPPSARRDAVPPPSPFVNPAEQRAFNDIADTYLQQVNYKLNQQTGSGNSSWTRLVVGIRFTIARDGHLVEAVVTQSSGVPEADRTMLQAFRSASPFPPLPAGLGASFTRTVPVGILP